MSGKPEWDRMLEFVHRRVMYDPRAQVFPSRVSVHGHTAAIFATTNVRTRELEARIERPESWLPANQRHGQELADQLIAEFRAQFDRIPQPRADGWVAVPELGTDIAPDCWVAGTEARSGFPHG